MNRLIPVLLSGLAFTITLSAQDEAVPQAEAEIPPPPEIRWTLSHEPGLITEEIRLTVACDAPDARIRFTSNGEAPTLESPLWEGEFPVDETVMLRFIAVAQDDTIVSRHGAAYLFIEPELAEEFSSNLPVVVVDSFGINLTYEDEKNSRSPKRPVWAVFLEAEPESKRAGFKGAPQFSGRAGMRVRGQSSTMFPKKQYSLELWDEEDDDLDAALMGFAEESDWILHAPYSDKTLMRNVLAYSWFREMGHYAVRTRYVELFYNADGDAVTHRDYVGVYVFMEKIKRDAARLPIAKLGETMISEPEISGGYIFKKDKGTFEDVHFNTRYGHQFGFVEPDEPNESQFSYLSGHLDRFERALYGPAFRHPDSGYASFIDVPSFIDVHIHVEICRNIDGFRLSTYYHKDREGKIVMGPVWDYNLSLGNTTMRGGEYPNGWYHHTIDRREYTYFDRLFDDPAFELQHWDRYFELRQSVFETGKLMRQIDAIAAELGEAQQRNFDRWPILGRREWQNPPGAHRRRTHGAEVAWLKDWLRRRLEWMDRQFAPPPIIHYQGQPLSADSGLVLSLPDHAATTSNLPRIFYTLDGADPRSEQGQPSTMAASVRPGKTARIDAQATTLKARSFDGRHWGALASAPLVVNPSLASTSLARGSGNGISPWILGLTVLALASLLVRFARRFTSPK